MLETWSDDGPKCPYCGALIHPDEGYFYDEGRYTEDECPECAKTFKVSVYISTSWRCTAEAAE